MMDKAYQSTTSITSFDDLIAQINQTAEGVQRERGTMFERLVLAYLTHEPLYKNLYQHVWMLADVPEEFGISKRDTGVDLVAQHHDGTLTAVQVKFYKEGSRVGKPQIDSFVAELGKDYYQHGMIVSSTDNWNRDARKTIDDNSKHPQVIGLSDLRHSKINWSQFDFKRPEEVPLKQAKRPRAYQKEAIDNAMKYYQDHDRGMLIMAPGTGKTYTSLQIAEQMANQKDGQFRVLYLVPSIQLLTQTLRGWNNDADVPLSNMAVTSDRNASREKSSNDNVKGEDIGYPATTNTDELLKDWHDLKSHDDTKLMVVFSTYQSIDVIGNAQKQGFPEFDLIIADEAHRTTGAKELGADSSVFTKVHSNTNVKGAKRLYQTATPKIYGENAKKKANDKSIVLASMDDPEKYGEEFYRLGFGQAVSHNILTDYKVMVLAIDESAVQKDMQKTLANPDNGLEVGDVGKIIGIWNGMMRRNSYKNPKKHSEYDGAPLERAIAFTRTIADSKKVANQFEDVVNDYLDDPNDQSVHVKVKHADGDMNALEKGDILDWLSNPNKPDDEARIVSNARFLTEGVDIPTLDAVIFLAPKRSQVDIVQAVGRIMRKSPTKEYGYVILPIVIPEGETPETVLDNNKNYEVVWQVINALRSVDERFEAMIEKLQIGGKAKQIDVINPKGAPHSPNDLDVDELVKLSKAQQTELDLNWDEFRTAIFGKIVQKVGNRHYLDNWSGDVAKIAQRQISWIKNKLARKDDPLIPKFREFVTSLKHNINDSIDDDQAAEMISQHLITKPIFDALFSQYDFVKSNPVSQAMEKMVNELEKDGFLKEQQSLEPLYESIKMRAEGIDDPKDKQKIIVTLYNQFFATAFKSTTERLGIVFTPIEVVDFIVNSVDFALNKYFGKSLANRNVHVLDPFTGTGTFIVRTLTHLKSQVDNGKITMADLVYKYTNELHANEIVLLSYYIAAINIESTFADIDNEKGQYEPFDGIVLTDTFESTENESTLDDSYFGTNDERLKKEQETPITAIISNPPYSVGQTSANDNNENVTYPNLNKRIESTYVINSNANLKRNLYDSYIKAFRWASDRLNNNGVLGFVTNGSFVDSQSMDGFRESLNNDFNHLYIFNLRGNQRTTGEESRKEGGKIFGSGSRAPISISILVKDSSNEHEIFYYDIGDYLNRDDKLKIIDNLGSINNINWGTISPDKNNDWINQRDLGYLKFASMYDSDNNGIFINKSPGVSTSRDSWVYGFSKTRTFNNINTMINNYDTELNRKQESSLGKQFKINMDSTRISWSSGLKKLFKNNKLIKAEPKFMEVHLYRPFTKKWVYYDNNVIERPGQYKKIFGKENEVILVPGRGFNGTFSALITNRIPDLHVLASGNQVFFKYDNTPNDLINFNSSNISDWSSKNYSLQKEDLFYYVYGVLHSYEFINKYSNDLKKDTPRIPKLNHMGKYVEIGKQLADLHLNYENQPSWEGVKVETTSDNPSYKVTKMKHPKRGVLDKIVFNNDITITNIPEKAYEYVVNGKPAIEWIIDQYRVKTDKKSGITDDPNDFSDDPKYILNLLLSVITVSMKTLELVDQLPKFEVIEEDNK